MTEAMLVTTVRPLQFERLLDSIQTAFGSSYPMCVFFQLYSPSEIQRFRDTYPFIKNVLRSNTRVPPHIARHDLLHRYGEDYDFFISLDDDMQIWPGKTNFAPAVARARQAETGIVSCNWVRTDSPKLIAKARYEDTFEKQNIVYMGGGMVFHRKIVQSFLKYPAEPYLFDDVQLSLIAYLEGYTNYRYLGSLLFHHIMSNSGIKQLYKERAMTPNDSAYIFLHPAAPEYPYSENNYHIPKSSDLSLLAHDIHRESAKLRGFING